MRGRIPEGLADERRAGHHLGIVPGQRRRHRDRIEAGKVERFQEPGQGSPERPVVVQVQAGHQGRRTGSDLDQGRLRLEAGLIQFFPEARSSRHPPAVFFCASVTFSWRHVSNVRTFFISPVRGWAWL
ncbi:hypothetical protein MASSI9I_20503 [Massilia sp. 9I]|nr:hypothetical protein MASSI9I_20503 [Massilia sp. 9I]